MSCPFLRLKEHEDTEEEPSDFLQFEAGAAARVRVPVPEPPVEVGVREPRRTVPVALAKAASVPIEVPERGVPDVIGPPVPKPGEQVPGRVALPGKPDAVAQVMRAAEESVGRVPRKVSFSREDFAFLERNQIVSGSVQKENALAGQARIDAIQTQMAEEAAAEAFAPAETASIDVLRELVQRPPAGLVAIPLLAEAFRLLRRSNVFRSAVPITPGRIGTAGAMDPSRPASTFRTGQQQQTTPGRTESRAPRAPTAGARPVTPMRRSFGGLAFNAAERMRELVGVSRRKVVQVQQESGLDIIGGRNIFNEPA